VIWPRACPGHPSTQHPPALARANSLQEARREAQPQACTKMPGGSAARLSRAARAGWRPQDHLSCGRFHPGKRSDSPLAPEHRSRPGRRSRQVWRGGPPPAGGPIKGGRAPASKRWPCHQRGRPHRREASSPEGRPVPERWLVAVGRPGHQRQALPPNGRLTAQSSAYSRLRSCKRRPAATS